MFRSELQKKTSRIHQSLRFLRMQLCSLALALPAAHPALAQQSPQVSPPSGATLQSDTPSKSQASPDKSEPPAVDSKKLAPYLAPYPETPNGCPYIERPLHSIV